MFAGQSLQEIILRLALILPLILFSLSVHEFAHGYVSTRLGDPTPGQSGRLTLNPLAHLDPLGTLALIFSSIYGIGFGWAKPVHINPRHYRNPVQGLFLVSVAGPLANLTLAAIFGLAYRLSSVDLMFNYPLLGLFLSYGVIINLGLFIFNLIPIAPFDGSRAVLYFIHGRAYEIYQQIQQFGSLILLALLFFFMPYVSMVIRIPLGFFYRLLTGA